MQPTLSKKYIGKLSKQAHTYTYILGWDIMTYFSDVGWWILTGVFSQEENVSQGKVLGWLPFPLFMNDITINLSSGNLGSSLVIALFTQPGYWPAR